MHWRPFTISLRCSVTVCARRKLTLPVAQNDRSVSLYIHSTSPKSSLRKSVGKWEKLPNFLCMRACVDMPVRDCTHVAISTFTTNRAQWRDCLGPAWWGLDPCRDRQGYLSSGRELCPTQLSSPRWIRGEKMQANCSSAYTSRFSRYHKMKQNSKIKQNKRRDD
jgi:hypothetical protein